VIVVHRLHYGGAIQLAPQSLLEGCRFGQPLPHEDAFVPDNASMNHDIAALHHLARTGAVSNDVADRQLNTYLLAVSPVARGACRSRLVLPITDAPHFTQLPDLGTFLHRVLVRSPLPGSLSALLQYCIPWLRHSPRPLSFEDSQDVLLNLVLALLLGLYPGGSVKRPSFRVRSDVFYRVHTLLTSPRSAQSEFCMERQNILLLACLEYVARLMPLHMPAQTAFLASRDPAAMAYFRRIPAMCDELRLSLDERDGSDWQQVQDACAAAIERVSRLKKSNAAAQPRPLTIEPTVVRHSGPRAAYWSAPYLLGSPSLDEFRLLGRELGLNGSLIHHIQQEIQVFPLPQNLRRLQLEALARTRVGASASAYLRTRHFVCTHCALMHKSVAPPRLRLDTLRQRLVCSSCSSTELISVDMVGRVLRHRRNSFVLCPACSSIQAYQGEEAGALFWTKDGCEHQPPSKAGCRQREACSTCSEAASSNPVERVDHLTGQIRRFFFCQRHMPRHDELASCVNARQISAYCK